MRRLIPPIGAVAAVVIVIALLLALNSNPQRDNAGPALISPTPPPTTSLSTPAAVQPTPTLTTAATRVEAKRTSRPDAPLLPVSVLNNSRRSGLAHDAAAQVAARGWPIGKIGNFTGRVAMSTLYYAPGQLPSAQRLARAMPAIRRVLPRFAGLPAAGLTLVVTRDWPA